MDAHRFCWGTGEALLVPQSHQSVSASRQCPQPCPEAGLSHGTGLLEPAFTLGRFEICSGGVCGCSGLGCALLCPGARALLLAVCRALVTSGFLSLRRLFERRAG